MIMSLNKIYFVLDGQNKMIVLLACLRMLFGD